MLRYHIRKNKTHHTTPDAKTFAYLELIKCFSTASFLTIFPIILYEKMGSEDYVGYYNSFISLIGFITCVLSSYLFLKYSKVLMTKITFIVSIVTLFGMTLATNVFHLMIFDIPRAICLTIAGIAISIYIADYSKKDNLAINEARYYFFANIAWVIAPISIGFITKYLGNESMFIISSLALCVALLYFLHQHLIIKHPHITHNKHEESIKELFKNIYEYFQSKERIKVFLVALGLNFWWTISFTYIPIAVKMMGYSNAMVGIVTTGGMIPLILFENWIGRQASKYGIKKYIFLGFLMLSLLCLSFIFLEKTPIILLIMFAVVNIGAAFIEPLQETYFFQEVKSNRLRNKFFGIYNTAEPIIAVTSTILASLILTASVGLNLLWIFTAIILFLFALIALTIKKGY